MSFARTGHTAAASLSVVLAVFGAGCSASSPSLASGSRDANVRATEEAITDVLQTPVERQSIGNCWIYADSTWLESLHKAATGQDFDNSQSYMTYWHWFDQIVAGTDEVSTGGSHSVAMGLIRRYGLVPEKDFVAADSTGEMSLRQSSALSAINLSLKSGVLSDGAARQDRATVRAELDRVWQLTQGVQSYMTQVFGAEFSQNLTTVAGGQEAASTAGSPILRSRDFSVAYTAGPGLAPETKTLDRAIVEWRQVGYRTGGATRSFHQRVQRALHDRQPVVVSWYVDFNALASGNDPHAGGFNLATLQANGPGSQGGHMVVMEDYQARLADGTVLAAGVTLDPKVPADQAKLEAALAPSTEIMFYRIKNSWGTSRGDRSEVPGFPGYHDLYMDYLNGPITQCLNGPDGHTDPENCPYSITPLNTVVLPPGY